MQKTIDDATSDADRASDRPPTELDAALVTTEAAEAAREATVTAATVLAVASSAPIAEEDLHLLADSARDFAMIFTDPNRLIVRWSAGAENVLGWTEEEVIGRDEIDLIFTPEDRANDIPHHEQETALRDGRASDERWHIKKDGTRFWAVGVMTPLFDIKTGSLRGFGKVLRNMSKQKRLEDALRSTADDLRQSNDTLEARVAERTQELEERTQSLRELTRRLVVAQEAERRSLSRELHDQTGQHLTGLSLALHSLRGLCPTNAETSLVLDRIDQSADALARDIHRIAVELRPPALDDLGLVPALENYIEEWGQRTGIRAAFESAGMPGTKGDRLPGLVEITIYRVVQEALNNVSRHAAKSGATPRASRVHVTLQRQGDPQQEGAESSVQVAIEDDGPGFDPEAALPSDRLGLAGMRERAESCGGTLEVESAPGEGTTIYLRLPTRD